MRTCDGMGDLGKVDLVPALRVTEPVLPPVRRRVIADRESLKLLERAIPVHLKVDANPAIKIASGQEQIQVRDACFHNHSYYFARPLVVRDPDLDRVPARNAVLDAGRKSSPQRGWELEELVRLLAMFVHYWDTRR